MNQRIISPSHLFPTFPRRYSLINPLICCWSGIAVISAVVSILDVRLLSIITVQADLLPNVISFHPIFEQIGDYCITELVLRKGFPLSHVMRFFHPNEVIAS